MASDPAPTVRACTRSSASRGPDPFSAVFFTNYSWHWDGEKLAGNPMKFVFRALKAEVPLPASEVELLTEALFEYGNVPDAAPGKAA